MTAATGARDAVLAAHERAEGDVAALAELADAASDTVRSRLLAHLALAQERAGELRARYLAALPRVALSRCPITGAAFEMAVDADGIDGLWWRYRDPVRAALDPPASLRGIVGALRLGADPERTGFLVYPGPGVPYVLPRVLADERTAAVVSQLAIGPHTGYAIAYFAPPPVEPADANEWGADRYAARLADGRLGWGERDEESDAIDPDLAPWIERGRVRWIAPGDASLTPRSGLAGCPFVGLDGPRAFQRIQYGRSWT